VGKAVPCQHRQTLARLFASRTHRPFFVDSQCKKPYKWDSTARSDKSREFDSKGESTMKNATKKKAAAKKKPVAKKK